MRSPFHTLALAALFLAAGPAACTAARQPPREALLSGAPTRPADRACRVAADPERLPTAAELVDDAFPAAAARLWEAGGRPGGYVLFSMRYDRDGLNVRRAVIEHSVGAGLADELQRLVFEHARRAAPASEEWGVRLRVDLGEPPLLRVGRREECRPAPREPQYRRAASGFDVRDARGGSLSAPMLGDPDLVWVRVWVDAAGTVTDAQVERAIYRSRLESTILHAARAIQFFPALDDGVPVPSEARIPLRLSALR